MALSRRNPQARLVEPLYEMQDVPRCRKDLSGSTLVKFSNRDLWMKVLPELLLLCNEATTRFETRCHAEAERIRSQPRQLGEKPVEIPADLLPIHHGKALGLEYITDRMDLDDPLHGYIVRTAKEGWVQGFITVTTFTSWQRWFRWDSLAEEAGVLEFDCEGPGLDALHSIGHPDPREKEKPELRWWEKRKVDIDGSLSAALNAEIRDGDPDGEGIIWPHVAELSLLGGIGCGSFLVQLVIEELENEDSPYNFLVLQATENAVSFYEQHGFVRVGAVARYFDKAKAAKPQGAEDISTPSSVGGEDDSANNSGQDSSSNTFLNVGRGRRRKDESVHVPQPVQTAVSMPSVRSVRRKLEDGASAEVDEPPTTLPQINGASSKFTWYKVNNKETPTIRQVAEKFQVQPADVIFMNRRVHCNLSIDGELPNGLMLRIPVFPSFYNGLSHNLTFEPNIGLASDTAAMVSCAAQPGESSANKLWYCARDNQTPRQIASILGVDTKELIQANAKVYPDLSSSSPLMENTILRVPGKTPTPPGIKDVFLQKELEEIRSSWGWGSDDEKQHGLSDVMTYRHWAFSDDPVDFSVASYMMVRPLKKRAKGSVGKPTRSQAKAAMAVKEVSDLLHVTFSADDSRSAVAELARERFHGVDIIPPIFSYGADVSEMVKKQVEELQYEKKKGGRRLRIGAKPLPPPATSAQQSEDSAASETIKPSSSSTSSVVNPGYPRRVNVVLRCSSIRRMRNADDIHRLGPLKAAVEFIQDTNTESKDKVQRRKRARSDSNSRSVRGSQQVKQEKTEKQERGTAVESNVHQIHQQNGVAEESMRSKRFVLSTDKLVNVYLRNSILVGPKMVALLQVPLKGGVRPQTKALPRLVKPRAPWNPYMCYANMRRPKLRKERPDLDFAAQSSLMGQEWRELPESEKSEFIQMAERERARYEAERKEYEEQLALARESAGLDPGGDSKSLVNQVVRLERKPSHTARQEFVKTLAWLEKESNDGKEDGVTNQSAKDSAETLALSAKAQKLKESHLDLVEHCLKRTERLEEDSEYYFVLTYIPDLHWCRLCPMHKVGTFDKKTPRHSGRTKWMLVPEGQAVEIDVSASRCQPVGSVAVKHTQDADQEEWDILE